jgi:hypothetical protein
VTIPHESPSSLTANQSVPGSCQAARLLAASCCAGAWQVAGTSVMSGTAHPEIVGPQAHSRVQGTLWRHSSQTSRESHTYTLTQPSRCGLQSLYQAAVEAPDAANRPNHIVCTRLLAALVLLVRDCTPAIATAHD